MKRVSALGRSVAIVAAVGLSVAMVSGANPAAAAQIGTVTFNGLTSQQVGFTVTTSGGCPTAPTNATNFQIRLTNDTSVAGNTAPTVSANITGNTGGNTINGGINAGPFTAAASATLEQFAANNGLGAQLPAGSYRVDLVCRTLAASASLGDFAGRIVIGSGGGITSAGPIALVVDAETATIVSAPASANWGASVSLTATVTNTTDPTGDVPVGTVQFADGGSPLGSPVSVNASGIATLSVSNLDLGSHDVTAAFTAGTGFNDSADASASTVTIALGAPTLVRAATLSGSIKVGGTAVCNTGSWSGATSYKYEFLKNGVVAQTSTTDFDIVLAAADLGKTLSCRVTGSNPIGDGTPSTTAAVKVAAGSAPVASTKPKITYSGSAANVGETVKVSKGTWSPSATYTYNYIWKRGSTVIKQGSTATSYKLTTKDKGKKITVTVQAKRTGYTTGSATTAAVTVK